jgi:hypothetical protein
MLDINKHLLEEIVLVHPISKVSREASVERIVELREEISLIHDEVQVDQFVAVTD